MQKQSRRATACPRHLEYDGTNTRHLDNEPWDRHHFFDGTRDACPNSFLQALYTELYDYFLGLAYNRPCTMKER